jgi:DedD protein
MAEEHDVDALKRRGRRRLVGAIALALLAVIVLPMVFDGEPQKPASTVSVRIPGEDDAPFAPKPPPRAAPPASPAQATPAAPAAKAPERPKSPPARTDGKAGQYIVQVGAFANPENVLAKLAAAKLPYYTEATKDNLTRVRAGPFPTREAAEKAAETLKGLGFTPGSVSQRAG